MNLAAGNLKRLGCIVVLAVLAVLPAPAVAAVVDTKATTVYVNQYFEVRDHRAPTKYIYHGRMRVAHVTGSLSENKRVQRFALASGWNLLSLAVAAPSTLLQLTNSAAADSAFVWVPQNQTFRPVEFGEDLAAGSVLWVRSKRNAPLAVTGVYSEPAPVAVGAGNHFLSSAGLQVHRFQVTPDPGTSLQRYCTVSGMWSLEQSGGLLTPSDPVIPPGAGMFIQNTVALQVEPPRASLGLRYYHWDHVRSCAALTDGSGALLEETAYYPFGAYRSSFGATPTDEPYSFIQKERDPETGLLSLEARFNAGPLNRFLSPDPLEDSGQRSIPQDLNPYAYGRNNPTRYSDPTGKYVWDQTLGGSAADDKVSADIKGQREAFREAIKVAKDAAGKLPDGADKTMLMRSLNAYGDESVANDVIVGYQSKPGGHAHYDGSSGKHIATFSLTAGEGARMAGTVAHEATHVADNRDFWAAAKKDRKSAKAGPLNLTDYQSEVRGYTVESILGQAMGRKTVNKAGHIIYDKTWSAAEREKNRAAAIDKLLEEVPQYKLTPANPGKPIL